MIESLRLNTGQIGRHEVFNTLCVFGAHLTIGDEGIFYQFTARVLREFEATVAGGKPIEQSMGQLVKEAVAIAIIIAAKPMQVFALNPKG